MVIQWLLISFSNFILFRLLSFYSKTYWKNDVVIAVAQGLIIALLLKFLVI